MRFAAHYPNYLLLRRLPVKDLFRVAASVWSGSKPDPHHKLPTMRPSAEIILGPQSGQSKAKIHQQPKLQASAPKGKGQKSGIGLLKRAASFLFGKRKLLGSSEEDEMEEGDTPSYPFNYQFSQYCGSLGDAVKKLEL